MNQLLKKYHQFDYSLVEMLFALALDHGIIISKRTLQRRLKDLNLKKYNQKASLEEIVAKILEELLDKGNCKI